jgi:hypothetical protein
MNLSMGNKNVVVGLAGRAPAADAASPDAAQAFIKFLVSPSARPKFIEVGLDYKE